MHPIGQLQLVTIEPCVALAARVRGAHEVDAGSGLELPSFVVAQVREPAPDILACRTIVTRLCPGRA
jgi:hypothetical protein